MVQEIKKYIIKHQLWAMPAILAVIIYIPVLIWLKIDNSLPGSNMGQHLYNSLEYGRLWHDFMAGHKSLSQFFGAYYQYPPLLYQISLIFYLFFGVSTDAAVASNLIWIFILCYTLYNSVRLFNSKKAALLSVAAFFAMPAVINASHLFRIDLAMAAWISLTYYLGLKYWQKMQPKYLLPLAITVALGLLLGTNYLVYVLIIGAVLLFDLLFARRIGYKKISLALVLILVVATAVAGYWYFANWQQIKLDFQSSMIAGAVCEGDPQGFTLANIFYYFRALISQYLLLPLLIVAVIASIKDYRQPNQEGQGKFAWYIIVLGYLLFTILSNKDVYFILPLAFFVAIIIGRSYDYFTSYKWQMAYTGAIIIILAINTSNSYLGWGGQGIQVAKSDFAYLVRSENVPEEAICNLENIVSAIPPDSSAKVIGRDSDQFSNWTLAYYLEKSGRYWGGQGAKASDSNYLVIRLDGSKDSLQTLFDYQNNALVAANINCADKSLVVVLKNQL